MRVAGVGMRAARQAVADYSRRMAEDGLVIGTSGNISIRVRDRIAASPTGVGYDVMTADDVCVVDMSGAVTDGELRPTSELPMHLTAYRVTKQNAVVHTHSPAATAVSTVVDALPNIHYLVAQFGGPVRVAAYATYGTEELAAELAGALDGRSGCLLANHGTITVGATIEAAYARARTLEWLCELWLRAKSAGEPKLLPDEEIHRVVEKLTSYGQAESRRRPR